LETLLQRHDEEGSDFYGSFIWNIMMLELWHRNYTDQARENRVRIPLAEAVK